MSEAVAEAMEAAFFYGSGSGSNKDNINGSGSRGGSGSGWLLNSRSGSGQFFKAGSERGSGGGSGSKITLVNSQLKKTTCLGLSLD